MLRELPKPPKSLRQFRDWVEEITASIYERSPIQTTYDPVVQTVKGFRYLPIKAGKASEVGGTIQKMKVKGFAADWLLCVKVNAGAEEPLNATPADYLKVAKPYDHQVTPFNNTSTDVLNPNKIVDGTVYHYAGQSLKWARRKATKDGLVEIQILVRPYYLEEIIFASNKVGGGIGVFADIAQSEELEWLDLNNCGRAWARTFRADPGDVNL